MPPLSDILATMDEMQKYERLMEAAGFKVWATIPFADGVQFDAHNLSHTQLVRGEKMPTPEAAIKRLYERCLAHG